MKNAQFSFDAQGSQRKFVIHNLSSVRQMKEKDRNYLSKANKAGGRNKVNKKKLIPRIS
jgi:hypothetical protein